MTQKNTPERESGRKKVDRLMKLHYEAKAILDKGDYKSFDKFLYHLFQNPDANELKMMQILMQSLKHQMPALWKTLNNYLDKAIKKESRNGKPNAKQTS